MTALTMSTEYKYQQPEQFKYGGVNVQPGRAIDPVDVKSTPTVKRTEINGDSIVTGSIFVEASKDGVSKTGARRAKMNAIPYDLVPFQEITNAYSRVAEFGAIRYESWNWTKGLPRVQIICSLLRHTFSYLRGEERDGDSGLMHTDHILWNAVALSHNVEHNLEDGRRVEPYREYKSK